MRSLGKFAKIFTKILDAIRKMTVYIKRQLHTAKLFQIYL